MNNIHAELVDTYRTRFELMRMLSIAVETNRATLAVLTGNEKVGAAILDNIVFLQKEHYPDIAVTRKKEVLSFPNNSQIEVVAVERKLYEHVFYIHDISVV